MNPITKKEAIQIVQAEMVRPLNRTARVVLLKLGIALTPIALFVAAIVWLRPLSDGMPAVAVLLLFLAIFGLSWLHSRVEARIKRERFPVCAGCGRMMEAWMLFVAVASSRCGQCGEPAFRETSHDG